MADYKLDIFEAMKAVDRRDFKWFSRQPPDAQKAFAPPVFLRWVSTVSDGPESERLLTEVNRRLNRGFWKIPTNHMDLIFRLAASCGSGQTKKHLWPGNISKKSSGDNKARQLFELRHPDANDQEIKILFEIHDQETFIDLAESSGLSTDETNDAIRSFCTIKGYAVPKATKGKKRG